MFIFLIILLLLSNSITMRRDKSILYSRTTITILITSALITYDNVNFLFHIFILLISSIILLTFNGYGISYIYTFITMDSPNVHSFAYVPLHSTSYSKEALSTFSILTRNKKKYKDDLMEANGVLKEFDKAVNLDKILGGNIPNKSMQDIMSHYKEYFDEDSGNTKEEGIKQIREELVQDFNFKRKRYLEAKKKWEDFKINTEAVGPIIFSCNIQFILSYIRYIIPYLTMFLSIISLMFCIALNFNLNILLYIPDLLLDFWDYILNILVYEIFITIPTVIWSFYSLWTRLKKSYNITKIIVDLFYKYDYSLYIMSLLIISILISILILYHCLL